MLAKQQNNSVDLKTLVCGIVQILFCQLRTTHKSKQFKKIIKMLKHETKPVTIHYANRCN